MKRSVLLVATAVALAGCGSNNNSPTSPSPTGPIVFTVQMSAANETPPVTNAEANARGTATITMNVQRDATGAVIGGGPVTFALQLSGFPAGSAAIAAHIHPGAAGQANPPVVATTISAAAPVVMADGTASVSVTTASDISTANAQAIVANPAGYYFNVHTGVNPGGAVRGQLVRQ